MTSVPAYRLLKSFDICKCESGRVFEPHQFRIGRLERGLYAFGDLLGVFQRLRRLRSQTGGITVVLIMRTFAALINVTIVYEAGDCLGSFPQRIASRINAGLALEFCEIVRAGLKNFLHRAAYVARTIRKCRGCERQRRSPGETAEAAGRKS